MKFTTRLFLYLAFGLFFADCLNLFAQSSPKVVGKPKTAVVNSSGFRYVLPGGQEVLLQETGGVIANSPVGKVRTAINGGLRGQPNQIWVVNAAGDGQAVDCPGCTIKLINGRPTLVTIQYDSTAFMLDKTTDPPTLSFIGSTIGNPPQTFRPPLPFQNTAPNVWTMPGVVFQRDYVWNTFIMVYKNGLLARLNEYDVTYDRSTTTLKITALNSLTWQPSDTVEAIWVVGMFGAN